MLNREDFAEPVRRILDKHLETILPLTRTAGYKDANAAILKISNSAALFPGARDAPAALSGLLLLLGKWDESHEVSQGISSPEGKYWHAIAHRIEPDSWNSGYWFRQVGQHSIFPDLYERATGILEGASIGDWRLSTVWDPFRFIEWCEDARRLPGTKKEQAALELQRVEWDLLFAWCAHVGG